VTLLTFGCPGNNRIIFYIGSKAMDVVAKSHFGNSVVWLTLSSYCSDSQPFLSHAPL